MGCLQDFEENMTWHPPFAVSSMAFETCPEYGGVCEPAAATRPQPASYLSLRTSQSGVPQRILSEIHHPCEGRLFADDAVVHIFREIVRHVFYLRPFRAICSRVIS
jgi:hypothetical protein